MHSLPSQFKSIRFSAHLDACLCYIDRDSRECHLLYSLLRTFWPCSRSLGNVLWEFKSLCLATAISLQSCAHMHSLRRQLWSSNARELNQKQFGWDNIERLSRMSHTISMGPHKHCTIGENLYSIWKEIYEILFGRPTHRLRGRVCDWGFSPYSSSGAYNSHVTNVSCEMVQMWTLWNKELNIFQWRNIVNWDFQDVERLGDMDIDLLSGVNIKMLNSSRGWI